MNENLSDFLIDVASDPSRLASFAADRAGELDRSSLTAEEREAILAGDTARIRYMLAGSNGGDGIMSKGGRRKGSKKKATKAPTKKKRPGSRKK
jgi:hypothetical protein